MTSDRDILATAVERQLGRQPRTPWRVAARCSFGFPTVIASPSRLDDGTPFPTLFWLTCPFLAEVASAAESAGQLAEWDERIAVDTDLAEELAEADRALRAARVEESGGDDVCASVGIAGQESVSATKCLHARVALVLVGIHDPIGAALIESTGRECDDRRCDVSATTDTSDLSDISDMSDMTDTSDHRGHVRQPSKPPSRSTSFRPSQEETS